MSQRPPQSPPHPKPRVTYDPRVFQANLVAAFEQSLVSMTSRLRHLAETAEEKVRRGGRGLPAPSVARALTLPRKPSRKPSRLPGPL